MIDANLHLINISSEEYNSPDKIVEILRKEWEKIDKNKAETLLLELSEKLKKNNIKKGLLYILDDSWFDHEWIDAKVPSNIVLGVLFSPFSKKLDEQIGLLKEKGIKFIKMLPYEQHIFKKDYSRVLKVAEKAQESDMILTICCAYGSRYLYETNGVELTSYLLNNKIKSPIIMAHGGMTKVLDAMSLMLEFKNLHMDVSFTIPYWWESRIIDDYYFAMKKLNFERIFYGSDYPYIDLEDSLEYFNKFCEKYNINHRDKEKVLASNCKKIIG